MLDAARRPIRRLPDDGGLLATSGALFAAVLSSACCWLPLIAVGLGASTAGVAGFFETYRVGFLAATGCLLLGGFYLAYRQPRACEPGSACALPNPKMRRFNKAVLWTATALVAVAASFPSHVGWVVAARGSARASR